ncbi:hypothetical protein PVAG01_09826 [Phlyctema vagabunda]|uniref:Uncharacterized protein n=1 Tax=Phlyctema vagabunda TaxID=108571 RepID=A0ABR4P466_9HELO
MHLTRRLTPATVRLTAITMLIALSVLAVVSIGEGFKIYSEQQQQHMNGRQLVDRQVSLPSTSALPLFPAQLSALATPAQAEPTAATAFDKPLLDTGASDSELTFGTTSQQVSDAVNGALGDVANNVQNSAGSSVPDSSKTLSALFAGGVDSVSSLLSNARQGTAAPSIAASTLSIATLVASVLPLPASAQPSSTLNRIGGFLTSTIPTALIPLPTGLSVQPKVPIPLISTCPIVVTTAFVQLDRPHELPGFDGATVTETFLSTQFAFTTTETRFVAAFTVTTTAYQVISTCSVAQGYPIAAVEVSNIITAIVQPMIHYHRLPA